MSFKPTTGTYEDDRYAFILQVEESGNPRLTPWDDSIIQIVERRFSRTSRGQPGVSMKQINIPSRRPSCRRLSYQDARHVHYAYVVGWLIMYASIAVNSVAMATPTDMQTCTQIRQFLFQRQKGHSPNGFILEHKSSQDGIDDNYPGLDIDNDGSDDLVTRSCGSGVGASCHLFIKLSSGPDFELEEDRFFLVRLRKEILVIVGESLSIEEKRKTGTRRIYRITKQAIELLCSNI